MNKKRKALEAEVKRAQKKARATLEKFHQNFPALLPFIEEKRKSLLPVEPIVCKSLV